MHYNQKLLAEIRLKYSKIKSTYENIVVKYCSFPYKTQKGKEFGQHGFSRRLNLMMVAIDNVFEIVPPEQDGSPTRDSLLNATINIQSYVFNTFGAVDNIAWIWMSDHGQKRANGRPIPDKYVGLGKKNIDVRQTLAPWFQRFLEGLDPWFEYQANLRHALAHRIPLYIPPYVIDAADQTQHDDLEWKIQEAAKAKNIVEYRRLSGVQFDMGRFKPWIQHSYSEGVEPIAFHPQMLADFLTVEQIAMQMLKQLEK